MKPEQEQRIVEDHLRKNGFRWTKQRALIVRTALATHDHFTAEELLDMCRKVDSHVSRATVYRTLTVLENAKFVEGLETGDGGRKFEHVLGHAHHDHMVCTVCGTIFEFFDQELERRQDLAARRIGFRIERHSLRIYGSCKRCCQQLKAQEKKAQERQAQEKKVQERQAQERQVQERQAQERQAQERQALKGSLRKTQTKVPQKSGSPKRSTER